MVSSDETGQGQQAPIARTDGVRLPEPGEVPIARIEAKRLRDARIVGFTPRDLRARAFNLLRSQIIKRLDQTGQNLLGVCSPAPGAGKSFVTLNLAAALSQRQERPVYLFDLDFRRGSVVSALGLEGGTGLGAWLSGETDDLAGMAQRVGGEHGFVLFPAYPNEPTGVELFASARFAALIAAIRALPGNAIVLCDLPPAFANDDAVTIVQHLDAFLLIVEQGETTRKQVTGALDLLQPTPCLGTVLNRYDGGWGDPYGYGYSDSYAHYYG